MTLNIFCNKSLPFNKSPLFDGEKYIIWNVRKKIHLEVIDLDLLDYILDDPFVPTYFINNEVVNKPRDLWTVMKKEKSATRF